ncbi:MAG: hypothetical protein ACPLX7_10040 [Candidatus Kapaibacteriota bacterium]
MSEKDENRLNENHLNDILNNIISRKTKYIKDEDDKALENLLLEADEVRSKVLLLAGDIKYKIDKYLEEKEKTENTREKLEKQRNELFEIIEEIKRREKENYERILTLYNRSTTHEEKLKTIENTIKSEHEEFRKAISNQSLINYIIVAMLALILLILMTR